MKNNLNRGFTGLEILIVLGVVSVVFGSAGYILKEPIAEQLRKIWPEPEPQAQEAQPDIKNPFPVKPSDEPVAEVPKEVITTPEDDGAPILPKITATGKWLGRFNVTSPSGCAGEDGSWEADLVETNGRISGSVKVNGIGLGNVGGTRVGESASWGVSGGASGVSFSGSISGNTISGGFTGLVCDPDVSSDRSKGSFFGGRMVN